MIESTLTAFAAFASTNIDDIFILMTLFTQVSGSLTNHHIMAGQYLGIISLILLSVAGALIGMVVPKEYIGLLGLFPIYLGILKVYRYFKNKNTVDEFIEVKNNKNNRGFFSTLIGVQTLNIAAITIANGGDNIGVYVPLFANRSLPELSWTIFIFLALVYVLVITAKYAISHPLLTENLKKYNHIVFPAILIGLGIYILFESGTLLIAAN